MQGNIVRHEDFIDYCLLMTRSFPLYHGCRGLTRKISDNEELRILVKEIILINHIGFNVFIRK